MEHYNQIYDCQACGWQGLGELCHRRKVTDHLMELDCPYCGENVGLFNCSDQDDFIIQTQQLKKEITKCDVNWITFPSLEQKLIIFVWDINKRKHKEHVITFGPKIIYTEVAFFGEMERYRAIGRALSQYYGDAFKGIVLSEEAQTVLQAPHYGLYEPQSFSHPSLVS